MDKLASTIDFYDRMAPFYHLIYSGGWEVAVQRQGQALDQIIKRQWGGSIRSILDVSCGIGTQTLGLARLGYRLTASDISPEAVARARKEASSRDLAVDFSVADMRRLWEHHRQQFDMILAADNSVPHLLTDDEILEAFRQFYACCRPGGGCLITVRDYENEDLTNLQARPYGIQIEDGVRHLIFQVWEILSTKPAIYELSMYFITDDPDSGCQVMVTRAKYYAITVDRVMALMEQAGFRDVRRIDDMFFQPVLAGSRKAA